MNKYPALKIVVFYLRFLGWVGGIVGLLSLLWVFMLIQSGMSTLSAFAITALQAFLAAFVVVMMFAAAELLMVLVDIEKGIGELHGDRSSNSQATTKDPVITLNPQEFHDGAILPSDKTLTTTDSIGLTFVAISPGSFSMGTEQATHEVKITEPFELATCPVTQEQFQRVMGTNPSKFTGLRNPVEWVSWRDAVEFCRKLSALPQEKAAGHVYRLPTEAEWEFACRADTTTAYSFGDDDDQLQEYGWYAENSGSSTHPVGEKKPNPWGLYDMHGNVLEWCQDWYGDYPSSSVTDPTGAASGARRVSRGGSWNFLSVNCRSAFRYGNTPVHRYYGLGFRVLRSSIK